MDAKYIEQLLERYWQCETTLEEEAKLRDFFSGDNIPARLLRYKDLFVYQQLQQEERLGEDFDARVLARVEAPVVKVRRLTMMSRLSPLFKAAAILIVLLCMGGMMQHSFLPVSGNASITDTISEQASAPSVALSGEAAVSSIDSLCRTDRDVEIKE